MKGTVAAYAVLLALAGCAGLSENQRVCNGFLPEVHSIFGPEYYNPISIGEPSDYGCVYHRQSGMQLRDYIGISYSNAMEDAFNSTLDPIMLGECYVVEDLNYSYCYDEEENIQELWLDKWPTDVEVVVVFMDTDNASGLYYPKEKLLALALAVSGKVG